MFKLSKPLIFLLVLSLITPFAVSCSKKTNTTIVPATSEEKPATKNTEDDIKLMIQALSGPIAVTQAYLFSMQYAAVLEDEKLKGILEEGRELLYNADDSDEAYDPNYTLFSGIHKNFKEHKILDNSQFLQILKNDSELMNERQFSARSFEIIKDRIALEALPETLKALDYDQEKTNSIIEHYKKNQSTINKYFRTYKGPGSYHHFQAFNADDHEQINEEAEVLKDLISRKKISAETKNRFCAFATSVEIFYAIVSREATRRELSLAKPEQANDCENSDIDDDQKSSFCKYSRKTLKIGGISGADDYCESDDLKLAEDDVELIIYNIEGFQEYLELSKQSNKEFYKSAETPEVKK